MLNISIQERGWLRTIISLTFQFAARILLGLSLRCIGIPYRLFVQNGFLAHLYCLQAVVESLNLTLVDKMLDINFLFICILWRVLGWNLLVLLLLIYNLLIFDNQVVVLHLFGLSWHFGDRLVRFYAHRVLWRLGVQILVRIDRAIFQLLVLQSDIQFEVQVVLMIIEKSSVLILRWWVAILLLGLRSYLFLVVVWAILGFASYWTNGGLLLVRIHVIFSMNFFILNFRYLLAGCFTQWPSLLIVTVLKTANSYA